MYSLSGRNARVVEAHLDGSHLVIRTTPYLNFGGEKEGENVKNFKLYLSWMLNNPMGPTKFDDVENSLDTTKVSKLVASPIKQYQRISTRT